MTTSGYKLEDRNFGFDSVRTFAQMECQIPNVRLVAAEGLDVDPQQAPRIMDEAIAGLDKLFSTNKAGSAKEHKRGAIRPGARVIARKPRPSVSMGLRFTSPRNKSGSPGACPGSRSSTVRL